MLSELTFMILMILKRTCSLHTGSKLTQASHLSSAPFRLFNPLVNLHVQTKSCLETFARSVV